MARNQTPALVVAATLLLVLAAAGVIAFWLMKSNDAPAAKQPDENSEKPAAANQPDVPDDVVKGKEDMLTSKVLVSDADAAAVKKSTTYIEDPKMPSGGIRGVCYVPFDKPVRIYPPMPIELVGENAIKDPKKGEQAYYESRKPREPVWLGSFYDQKKRYGVKGAVVMLKGVEAGKQPLIDRISLRVDYRNQQIVAAKPQGENVRNCSWYTVGVSPFVEMIHVVNLSLYDCDIEIKRADTGRAYFAGIIAAYADPKFPGEHYGTNFEMARPKLEATQAFREPGIYNITCKRHPWQKAYLVVVDNPYVAMSEDTRHEGHERVERAGEFSIGGVPPGKFRLEVWHPEYEPERSSMEVEILRDQVTEIAVPFKVPPILKRGTELREKGTDFPDTLIMNWAFVGPFDSAIGKDTNSPQGDFAAGKFDFKARYENADGGAIRWKEIAASKDERDKGWLNLQSLLGENVQDTASFFAVKIDSPTDQPLSLCVWGGSVAAKFWLNGALIHYTYKDELIWGWQQCETVIVTGRLKAGENVLLVRIDPTHARAALRVAYAAKDATVSVPLAK